MEKLNLRYQMYGSPNNHPQKVMKELGIKYEHSTPQSIADQWWFWDCTNVPKNLPEYLEKLNISPYDAVGYGLSKETADILAE